MYKEPTRMQQRYSFVVLGMCVIQVETTNLAKTCVSTVCKVKIVQGYASSNAEYDHDEPSLRKRLSSELL